MRNANIVVISGRLGADPETRQAGRSTVTKFSVAVNQRWEDESGVQERVNWIPVSAWNRRGEVVARYLRKGCHVLVHGSLNTVSWDAGEAGQKRTRVEVTAWDITFLDAKGANANEQQTLPEPEEENE